MIADIYVRVSSKQQERGNGLERQENACRHWCEQNQVEVRTAIQDIGSGFRQGGQKALFAAYDRWRKGYWDGMGELSKEECDIKVVGQIPPHYLVFESIDRFSRRPSLDIYFFLMMLGSMGTTPVPIMEEKCLRETMSRGQRKYFLDDGKGSTIQVAVDKHGGVAFKSLQRKKNRGFVAK